MNSLRLHYYLTDFTVGIILMCLPIYFKVFLGFSSVEIGMIYLIGGIVAVISAVINSIIAQKIKKKKLVFNIGLLLLVLGVLYFNVLLTIFDTITFNQAILGSVFIFAMRSLIYILADEITTVYSQENENADYGKIRSFGSLGWGSNFLITGMILVFIPKFFMLSFLVITILIWINSFFLPNNNHTSENIFKVSDIKKVFKMNNYILFLIVNTLMLSVLNNMNIILEYTIVDNDMNLALFYILSTVFIVFDMITIHYSSNILKKLKARKYMFSFMLLLLIRLLLLAGFSDTTMVYFAIVFDCFIFGMFIPFNSIFTRYEAEKNLLTILFMLSASFALISSAIFSPIFGYVYDVYGSKITFFSMSIIIICALFIASKIDLSKVK